MPQRIVRSNVSWQTLPLLTVLLLHCGGDDASTPQQEQFAAGPTAAGWAAAPQDATEGFGGGVLPAPSLAEQSIRQLLRVSTGGEGIRVRLSNLYGTEPLTVDAAAVAPSMGSGVIDPASSVPLTFADATSTTVPAGKEAWSDFVPLASSAGQELAVTLYVAAATPVGTLHSVGLQTAYVTSGNAVQDASIPTAYVTSGPGGIAVAGSETEPSDDGDPDTTTAPLTAYYWITGVDVAGGDAARRVVVAFGDSITDGVGSTNNAYSTYPDLLSQRLNDAGDDQFSVVNVGISANRVLNDGIGQRGVDRFGRDVLMQTGVSDVVILLSINDIGFSGFNPDQSVTVDEITAGLATMIGEASAAGVQVRLGTLTPLEGTMAPYYSAEAEAMRGAVNTWIRANTDVVSIIDFDQVVQDPVNPLAMLPAYDSGDHLHPGDEGYVAMAAAVAQDLMQ